MSVRFAHIADVHLGYKQYGCEERAVDFAQAFLGAIKLSIERNVDFILIAGDLFHRKSEMDPLTLTQAIKVLEKAKKAKVPVIAVEGNHDSAYFRETFSWLDYLAREGLLVNLKPSFDDGIVVEEWNGESGAYIDLDVKGVPVRVYGMKYYGSMTERVLEMYTKEVRKVDGLTIFMAHAGIEGYVNVHGCVPSSRFHKLKADYIALGHIHRSFVEGRIHNPGSLEVCDVTELGFDRGVFVVDWEEGEVKARLEKVPGRDFVALSVELREERELEELKKRLKNVRAKNPVVYVSIRCPRSVRRLLSEESIKEFASHLSPIVVKVKWEVFDDTFAPVVSRKEDLEVGVISQLLENYSYGNICEEVIKLKSAFSTSFDLRKIDEFVDEILRGVNDEEQIKSEPSEMRESCGLILSRKSEKAFLKLTKAITCEVAEKGECITGRSVATSDRLEKVEARGEFKGKESAEEEEVWDWRKAYDPRSKARKH